ncbi:MAG TPA: DNA-3-methyladenine glycosylase 2 family protein [Acidimicrobiia bacterium]|nr:DNA-3-methyladenine glycosylase 2 family protein [Acidimicrobiia bacterium]
MKKSSSGAEQAGSLDTLIPVEVPLDLRRTLRPLGGRFLADGWWLPARTPQGPATVHVRRDRRGVVGRGWGEGAEWLLERLPNWIGLGDDPKGLVSDHPLIHNLTRSHPGFRFGTTGLVFDALVVAIVTQKVTGKEAKQSLIGLANRFSDFAPGPRRLRLPPDPERMAAAPYWEFHVNGLERRRADILRRVSAAHPTLERLSGLRSDEVQKALRRYPGIGVWTAAETVAVSHGDADAVSVGDYHHKNLVAWHLTGRPRGTDDEMLQLLEPFRPHRGRVVRLLELAGRAPAYGPRMPLRQIADR